MDYYDIQYVTEAVAACVVLHNICELNNATVIQEWIHLDQSSVRDHSTPHVDMSRRSSESATRIRDALKEYLYLH